MIFFTKASQAEDLFEYFFTSKPIIAARSATCQRKTYFLNKYIMYNKTFSFDVFEKEIITNN